MKRLFAVSVMSLAAAVAFVFSTSYDTKVTEPIAQMPEQIIVELPSEEPVESEPEFEVLVTDVKCDPIPKPTVDTWEHEMIACVIYQEAGADTISDETRYKVGDVVLTHVADNRFPNTIEEVLMQKGQYGLFHWTGVTWPERASNPNEAKAVERAYTIAWNLLTDTHHSNLYGKGYIWQAEFEQGYDVVYADGIYFGK